MPAGRPRIPTDLAKAKGAFLKHPERLAARATEPRDDRPLGDPPEYFTDSMLAVWAEVVSWVPPGVLKFADRGAVEVLVRSLESFRQLTEQVVTKTGEVVEIEKLAKPADAKAILAMLGAFGCTPADRSKVQVSKPAAVKTGFEAFDDLGPPQ